MTEKDLRLVGIVDNLIYFFSILFLCTLTNSIFLNQLGYYIPLVLIIIRFYLTKENPFTKTGLEFAFVFYIIAEILSTLFSVNAGQSLQNLSKRFLLIPITYTFLISSHDFDRTKKFVLIYLGSAIITMIVYLGLSYNYFINNFYQLYESGPSTFQYPITSSELMSFSLVFLFAFLINEKTSVRNRLFILILFIINLLALLATYKRTGWIGAAAGILVVIIISRKWILLSPVILLIIVGALIEKNISSVTIYDYKPANINVNLKFDTEGRAYNILVEGDDYFISDFENGLIKYHNNQLIRKYELDAPVVDFKKWTDSFYVANLIDIKFILMKSSGNGTLEQQAGFLSPGFTSDWRIFNGYMYVIDSDSGMTIFRNPNNLNDRLRYKNELGSDFEKVFVDSSYIVLFTKFKDLTIIPIENKLPGKSIITKKLSDKSELIYYKDSKLIISENNGLNLYSIQTDKIVVTDKNDKIADAFTATESNNKLFVATTGKELFEIVLPLKNELNIISTFNLGIVPKSIAYSDGKLFVTHVKRNRLLSIVDPYLPSNFTRLSLWRAGLLILKDNPIVGVGDIDLAGLYKQYKRASDKEIQGHMHNNYVHLLVTLGVFGFAAVIFLLIKILIVHIKNYFSLKDEPFASSYALGATGSFIAFLVSGLTEWNFGDHEIITMIWFMLAISLSFVKYRTGKKVSIPE